jgi:PAS domain-containing protein
MKYLGLISVEYQELKRFQRYTEVTIMPGRINEHRDGATLDAGVLADYVVETDMHLRYTHVSEGFCKILGYDRWELLGKRVADITA